MPETKDIKPAPGLAVRHRGRMEQVGIYLRKFLRMFVYESDWKVLPMSAFIAGLVGMVIRASCFLSMEGTLMGVFALVMVCIWNGCFNSIQVICRERSTVKREHRSGMHISAYITAHMLYQALLCLMQTAITLFTTYQIGLRFDLCRPLFTPWFMVDFGVSMFLISYAADMMALWISSMTHSTTAAMTIMPFVLIFQLVFSGGMFTLPEWSAPMLELTISAQGMNVLAAQGEYNKRPLVALWNKVQAMGDTEIGGTITLGQVLDFLNEDTPLSQNLRDQEIDVTVSLGQVLDYLGDRDDPQVREIRAVAVNKADLVNSLMPARPEGSTGLSAQDMLRSLMVSGVAGALPGDGEEMTLGDLIDSLEELGLLDEYRDSTLEIKRTVGQILEMIAADDDVQALRDKSFPFRMSVAELQSRIGVESVRVMLQETAAAGNVKPAYDYTEENVLSYWARLVLFTFGFAALAMISLEFIDKDKR